jgi:hypothetical protein
MKIPNMMRKRAKHAHTETNESPKIAAERMLASTYKRVVSVRR